MPDPDPSHPYVDSASIAGTQITLRVEVTEYGPAGGSVEISGKATQSNGALANIYAIEKVPDAPDSDGDDKGRYFVNVTSDTIPPNRFSTGEDLIVYVTVSRPWVTVMERRTNGKGGATNADAWGPARRETHVDGSTWHSVGRAARELLWSPDTAQ